MWEFIYSISIALYLVGNYVEWRDSIFTLVYDASSLWLWLSSRRQIGDGGASFSSSRATTRKRALADHHNSTAMWTPPGSSEMKLRTRALFALGPVAALPYRTYQGTQVHSHLRYMTGLPPPASSPEALVSMSLHTPLSFARVVRDFVALKCSENGSGGDHDGHRFFVFHPDTAWVGAFQRLHDVEGPLPPEFAGVAHNLFVLARWMLCERVALVQALGDDAGRRVRFHVLVPTTETLVVPQPFCLVEALLPLTIEGPISKGHPLVWFAVAAAGSSTAAPIMRDVGAIPPPCPEVAEGKAFVAMCLLWIAASPLLLAVCKMLCFAQLPFYVALAMSLLFHGFALNLTLWLKRHVCEYYMREDAPMMLG
ncbi:hypothetical protein ISF_00500 [Cordyceps fumosorosea ARSEF 2679]|uniref:Uncharacterized protein n=1 Tax=Cordyceps fumosorosea (strain ARSEF 2679) TaxID=1081104 RepID=A0A162N0K0_CORFA|nr:hypothetical protein ISF_00500 [Cordyceps fumosorosea ARSEF 2679]OAA73599.1 hypothetical protein ISF_00500 [Cordyceps fumosorosea ARSEF 2679]